MAKILETKLCAWCRELFTAVPRRDGSLPATCGRTCSNKLLGQRQRGRMPAVLKAAVVARRVAARWRAEDALRREFGEITDREAKIYAMGEGVGYKRGYNLGYGERHRKTA